MSNKNPLISIIIPVFNGARFLPGAIKNILSQTYKPIEIIIIDDGSTDNSAKIAIQYKRNIRYFCQSNKGPAAARNLGIKKSHGDFIAFLDVDDLWPDPNRLKKQMSILLNNPKIDIVRGIVKIVTLSDASEHSFKQRINKANKMMVASLAADLFRKNAFEKVGYLDEDLAHGEDLDWYKREIFISR